MIFGSYPDTRLVTASFLIGIGLYGIALSALYLLQRHILFVPLPFYQEPSTLADAAPYREITVETKDHIYLKGWYAPSSPSSKTIVFFHGNADRLTSVYKLGLPYISKNYGVLLVEYRGYSGLEGSPSEEGLYNDADAFVHYLLTHSVREDSLIFYGHSLGTGVAVEMARHYKAAALMLLAPYRSIPQVAEGKFPIFPVKTLIWDRFDNYQKIGSLKIPLLIAHGKKDAVVPFKEGKMLFEQAQGPKKFISFPQCGHNNCFDSFAKESLVWLETLFPQN